VFKIKHRGPAIEEADLQPKQFKARVVIRGQYMKEGLDFNDTFAPVAKPMTIRAVLAVATKYGCKLKAGDVETAFLTADMDCEVWVKMPSFWGPDDKQITGQRYECKPRRLLKGVPGIPQGSRLYYETFAAQLKSMGWLPSAADKCLFLNPTLAERTAALIWVDDFIFMHEQESTWERFLKDLRKRFTIPTVGTLTTFLGMNIQYDAEAKTMTISQPNCIQALLERAGMLDCNPALTPCPTGILWTKQDCPDTPDAQNCTNYRKLIALANFVSCWTRPDITFTVNKLCKYMSNPGEAHWKVLKHLLRYLKGTQRKGLCFDFGATAQTPIKVLHGYTDASYADCPDSGRSTVAYVFYLGSAIISWYSKLHSCVTTSTNHSEYAALAMGAKEAQWLVYLFDALEPGVQHTPLPIYTDNSGVISLVFNPVDHAANKHIRVSCHYARELTQEGVIAPQRVSTELNLADLFTKALAGPAFKLLVDNYIKEPASSQMTQPVISSRGGVSQLTAARSEAKSDH
jgi:histone deacetylase 1/2